ncbi:OPA3-domain-containing protein [Laetiporus sulphureus 93-53]|uniref:OPA3-domain-containing protein n=1 Tax=Laetiporus sulphureus 93-53 TaxID=1314785 RepID=A0A165H2S2_9APHY|nr:OPA3-domain-containing protein [Laetiporus sulphureus 93-53]KZT11164.1 OPA3-domain-containing protein [Laetiporus sulphureus 93-53]
MASTKIAILLIRTIAKPISNQIKTQAKQHEKFREFCVNLAQGMYRTELNMRTNLLGEPTKHIRPLSETRAIENGANALAEGFLFSVAAILILGETWRSSRNQSKRRDSVDDALEELQTKVAQLTDKTQTLQQALDERWEEEKQRNDELARILERVVEIGLRGGWAEFEGTPLSLPRIQLTPFRTSRLSSSDSESDASASQTSKPGNASPFDSSDSRPSPS